MQTRHKGPHLSLLSSFCMRSPEKQARWRACLPVSEDSVGANADADAIRARRSTARIFSQQSLARPTQLGYYVIRERPDR